MSEFERGKRPQVSLDTAMRLLHLVNVSLTVNQHALPVSDEASRRERAELRRRTWSGEKTTLAKQQTPVAPASNVGRLTAVARASRLAGGLQNAYREASARQALKRAT